MGSENIRQLAAVMFSDIVGYTATMQEDEAKANKQRECHRSVMTRRSAEFGGKILHFYGDGAIIIFNSAFDAVSCGICVQKELKKRSVPIRLGLDMGDVVYNDEDIFGDAVNIASRLEGLAKAGSILISGKIKDEIKNNGAIKTIPLGSHPLKNVKQPVRIYAVGNPGLRVPSPQNLRAKTGGASVRVMVLPFMTMTNEGDFEYFSDGLSEEIINELTKLPGVEVTSRTSAFAYKNQNKDVCRIGKKHAVSHVLEGSVRKNGNKIRVTAQLIETGEGFHLWSETYKQHLNDIFYSQDIICAKIVKKIRQSFDISATKKRSEMYEQSLKTEYAPFSLLKSTGAKLGLGQFLNGLSQNG
ncbi:MAG TPA: adenylate/guanylate cyclase domain-containing protein [Balneolaceae bacterium]|nr:adenylate/guanylate cyclase domain-containing protein [Balneolaceae bacterium]